MSEEGRFCTDCGARLAGVGRFCAACGAPVEPGDGSEAKRPSGDGRGRGLKIGATVAVLIALALLMGSVAVALSAGGTPASKAAAAATSTPMPTPTATIAATATTVPTSAPVVVVVATPTPDVAARDYLSRTSALLVKIQPFIMAVGNACGSPSPACQAAYDKNWPLFIAAAEQSPTSPVPAKCSDADRRFKDYFSAAVSYLGTVNFAVGRTTDLLTFLKATNPGLEKMSQALGLYTNELKYGACHA